MSDFSQRLLDARLKSKMTQEQLAHACGRKTCVTICRWEKGKTEPSIQDLANVCKILHVDANWLLGITQDPSDAKLQRAVDEIADIIKKL